MVDGRSWAAANAGGIRDAFRPISQRSNSPRRVLGRSWRTTMHRPATGSRGSTGPRERSPTRTRGWSEAHRTDARIAARTCRDRFGPFGRKCGRRCGRRCSHLEAVTALREIREPDGRVPRLKLATSRRGTTRFGSVSARAPRFFLAAAESLDHRLPFLSFPLSLGPSTLLARPLASPGHRRGPLLCSRPTPSPRERTRGEHGRRCCRCRGCFERCLRRWWWWCTLHAGTSVHL